MTTRFVQEGSAKVYEHIKGVSVCISLGTQGVLLIMFTIGIRSGLGRQAWHRSE